MHSREAENKTEPICPSRSVLAESHGSAAGSPCAKRLRWNGQWDLRTLINNDTERNAESPPPPSNTPAQEWKQAGNSCYMAARYIFENANWASRIWKTHSSFRNITLQQTQEAAAAARSHRWAHSFPVFTSRLLEHMEHGHLIPDRMAQQRRPLQFEVCLYCKCRLGELIKATRVTLWLIFYFCIIQTR